MYHRYVKQEGLKDCGVCCLYNIVKYHKGSINIEKLRKYTKTDENGTNIYNIVNTANMLGLKSNSYRCEINDLCNINYPIIAHIKLENNCYHFIIIDRIIDDELIIFDPIRGILKYSMDDFSKEWTGIIITFEKTNDLIKEKESNYFSYFIKVLIKYKGYIIFISILSFLCSLFTSIDSFYLSSLYKNKNVFLIFILFIFILMVRLLLDFIKNNILLKFSKSIDKDMTNKVYKKILSLPIEFHHSRPVGDVVSRLNDLSYIKNFINELSFSFFINLIFIFITGICLFIINMNLSMILIFIIVIYIISYYILKNNLSYLSIINKENNSNMNTFMMESILGIDTIKNLNISEDIYTKYKKMYKKTLNNNINYSRKILNINIFEDFITTSGIIIIMFFGINYVNNKIMTLSDLITFNSLLICFLSSIKNLIKFDKEIIDAKSSYKRIKSLITSNDEQNKNTCIEFKKYIKFINVSYSYNQNKVLENFNYIIHKNEYVFIKGRSGIGKSTLFKLLTKQIFCSGGNIFIDNIDINELSYEDIVNNICYVSQNEYLFTDTILNNIIMYKNINKEELDKVLKITMVDKILENRNIKLDYILEENGHNLSGGEKQKILLARSLLRGTSIIILDETMNEIDVTSEKEILSNIKNNYNITLILISHRDININLFDKVLEIS